MKSVSPLSVLVRSIAGVHLSHIDTAENTFPDNVVQAFVNNLIAYRKPLLVFVILVSLGCASTIDDLKVEHTLNLTSDPQSPSYADYLDFVNTFGTDQSLLFAVKLPTKVTESRSLEAVSALTKRLRQIEGINDVLTITNLRLPEIREGVFGIYPLARKRGHEYSINVEEVNSLRKTWPVLNMLASTDLETLGILITLEPSKGFGPQTKRILDQAEQSIRAMLPGLLNIHKVGVPVMALAFQKYNLETARNVGLLAGLVATLVALYLFKSLRVAGLVVLNGGLAVLWLVGLMSAFGVELHMVTSVAFGMIMVLTIPTVVHIVSHFTHHRQSSQNSREALQRTLMVVSRPCLMCSVTTSIGFASLMLSPMRVVSQMGLIMSVGTMLSFLVTMIVTANYLLVAKPLSKQACARIDEDWLSRGLKRLGDYVFERPRSCVAGGLIVVIVMAVGTPYIKSDAPGLHMLRKSSPEAKSIEFVENNLMPLNSISVILAGAKGQFTESQQWMYARLLTDRLRAAKGVIETMSPLPVLENLFLKLNKNKQDPGTLFTNPQSIPQLLFLISSSRRAVILGQISGA